MPATSSAAGIDWSGIGSVLQGLGTLTGAIAVIVAARVGASTFDSWRQQKLSERRIEQAERILTATYKVRRALSYVRSPMMWPHEFVAAEEKLKDLGRWDGISKDEQQRLSTAQAYYNRLNATLSDRQALEECQPMARALFGEGLEMAIETLNRQFNTVRAYVDANSRRRDYASAAEFQMKIDAALYQGYPSKDDDGNEMDQTIADQVKLIEEVCVPVLRLESGKRTKSWRGGWTDKNKAATVPEKSG